MHVSPIVVKIGVTFVVSLMIVGIGLASYRIITNRQVVHQAPTVSPRVTLYRNSDFANAPEAIKSCVRAIIAQEAFDTLIANTRPANQTEKDIFAYCFRPEQKTSSSTPLSTPSSHTEPPRSATVTPTPKSHSTAQPLSTRSLDTHAEVWTKNGYDGVSYEYKVNCGPNYDKLETCFLWDLTQVVVTTPSGSQYTLKKDFNINSYSGEVTRRWVLYGPGGGGLPAAGKYTFTYYRDDKVAHTQTLNYKPSVVSPPSNITYKHDGKNLTISWFAPKGINSTMWYKPSVDPPGNDRQIISKTIAWDKTSATLKDVPVSAGEQIEINVAVFFPGGYAYPRPMLVTW